MEGYSTIFAPGRRRRAATAWLAAASSLMLHGAGAADNGPTLVGEICMQKVYGTPVTNSNALNCTANDIRLSRAISVSQQSCVRGTTFDLTGTFETVVTANSRYDAGFFFRIDGGANARGDGSEATGVCSLSALNRTISPALNLDGDTAGDLNSGTYNLTFTIPGVQCEDDNGDGYLDLPNCTSWHSNQGTVGTLGTATTFKPDTKSKCVCDDTFQVPVRVEEASITVDKTASPLSRDEPGGAFTFTVTITNDAAVESVTLTKIEDDIHGDVGVDTDPTMPDTNTCDDLIDAPTTLGPGGTASCYFTADVYGNAGYTEKDTVTVTATQDSTGGTVTGSDDATVSIDNAVLDQDPTLAKVATAVANCRADATYQVTVSNISSVDVLTVTTLSDDKFGDITTVHGNVLETDCSLPQDIAILDNYSCQFVGRIEDENGSCDFTHTNTLTGTTADDDGTPYSPEDTASVSVKAEPVAEGGT